MKEKVFDHTKGGYRYNEYYLGVIRKPGEVCVLKRKFKTATLAELYAEKTYFRYLSLRGNVEG